MPKRTYDIRLRNAVARYGDAGLFPELEIPRSTALDGKAKLKLPRFELMPNLSQKLESFFRATAVLNSGFHYTPACRAEE